MLIFHLHVVFALTTILRTRSDAADRGRGVYCFFYFNGTPEDRLTSCHLFGCSIIENRAGSILCSVV